MKSEIKTKAIIELSLTVDEALFIKSICQNGHALFDGSDSLRESIFNGLPSIPALQEIKFKELG